jgi:hypothetical protein
MGNSPINRIDPDGGEDWYLNKETGEVDWRAGSEEIEGYKNLGASYVFEGTSSYITYFQREIVNITPFSSLTDKDNSVMSGALIASAALLADDATVIGVIDDLAIPIIIAGALAHESIYKVYVTYTLTNPITGQRYAGRTSGYGDPYTLVLSRYRYHHMKALGFMNPKIDVATVGLLGYPAIRGREQQLIDLYGKAQSEGGTAGNRIRGVGKFNLNSQFYHTMSNIHFGLLYSYTGW